MAKTHPLGFRIEPDIKEALTVAAKEDHRSVSSLVELIIAKWLRENGYLAGQPHRSLRPALDA
ncbi:hypothetical protein [Kumtagia ephedrae]|jgi:hypothetical protein|uniref:Uncharacterized protein n=1 Tax=Kumtagia ephedrae TaxID=2116701 RepID=A0A2P7SDJ4_9HYPH|nr:hypothetical protein [Mesorhizobium ephedrae]PSJ60533.1 hypothetical protein C7I84_11185 [Mesorhizobium ephedrae]